MLSTIFAAEFIGEEGVGLGPTLEFFTLISHKLQQKQLKLWFDDDDHGKHTNISGSSRSETSVERSLLRRSASSPVGMNDIVIPEQNISVPCHDGSPTRRGNRKRTRSPASCVSSSGARSSNRSKITKVLNTQSSRMFDRSSDNSIGNRDRHENYRKRTRNAIEFERTEKVSGLAKVPPLVNALQSKAVVDPHRADEFHQIGILVCRGCQLVEVPHCSKHTCLLVARDDKGHWHCDGGKTTGPMKGKGRSKSSEKRHAGSHKSVCNVSSRCYERACKVCGESREIQEWLVSEQVS